MQSILQMYDEGMLQRAENELRHKLLHTSNDTLVEALADFFPEPYQDMLQRRITWAGFLKPKNFCRKWIDAGHPTPKRQQRLPCPNAAQVSTAEFVNQRPPLIGGSVAKRTALPVHQSMVEGTGASLAVPSDCCREPRWSDMRCMQDLDGGSPMCTGRRPLASAITHFGAALLPCK